MPDAFLTTKHGFVNTIKLTKYSYSDWIIADQSKRDRLKIWLEKKSGFLLNEVGDTCFFSFEEIAGEQKQYHVDGVKILSAPFENTQAVSGLIANLLRREFGGKYKQYLNYNTYVIESIDFYPFTVLKAIEFNIEVFSTGHYLIHLMPVAKIVGNRIPADKKFINEIKSLNRNKSSTDSMCFNIINLNNLSRKNVDLLDKKLDDKLNCLSGNDMLTFDYHFLASFSPELFGEITNSTAKDIKSSVWFANKLLENTKLPGFFNLSGDRFFKVSILELETKNNLLTGGQAENVTIYSKSETQYGIRLEYTRDDYEPDNLIAVYPKSESVLEQLRQITVPCKVKAKIEQWSGWKYPHVTKIINNPRDVYSKSSIQSACFYNGIFKPVNNFKILPVLCDGVDVRLFEELVPAFNKGSVNFSVLPAVKVPKSGIVDTGQIREVVGGHSGKVMLAVFCKYQMPFDFLNSLKGLGLKYQLYQGDTSDSKQNRAKMSNFVCRCLEKSGGIISAICDTHVGESGYFIGLDLGHTTHGNEKFSNLAVALFDCQGILVGSCTIDKIPRKENLIEEYCTQALRKMAGVLFRKKLPIPKQLIIHRDGKLHAYDVDVLVKSVKSTWGNIEVDIVEIIKSGFPIIAIKTENGKAVCPPSGSSYQDNEQRYAILVTNIQAEAEGEVVNPIIIKHKFGATDFNKIVEQVYWFTKVYTNNLYNSTRLPATTLKANNIVSTSSKQHKSTYLG